MTETAAAAAAPVMPLAWHVAIQAACTPDCWGPRNRVAHTAACTAEYDRIGDAWLRASYAPVQGPAPAATCAYCGQALIYRITCTYPGRQERAWCGDDGWGTICGSAPEGQHVHVLAAR